MTPTRLALLALSLATLSIPRLAAAEPDAAPDVEPDVATSAFHHQPGFRLGLGLTGGSNHDPDQTITSAYYLSPELGYVFSFGTEPFVTAGLGVGGKEGSLFTFGAGLRQRLRLGRFEPFAQVGYSYVGDGEPLHMTPGLAAGLDFRISPRATAGFTAGRYFQQQDDQATLDWYTRVALSYSF